MRRLVVLALSFAAPALLAACGGGSSRLSHAEFARQGNKICTDYYRRLERIPQPKGPDELVSYVTRAKRQTEATIDDLAALQPPEKDEHEFDAFLAVVRREVKLEERLVAAARANDMKRVQSLANSGSALDDRANAHARRAGLRVCGSPPPGD